MICRGDLGGRVVVVINDYFWNRSQIHKFAVPESS